MDTVTPETLGLSAQRLTRATAVLERYVAEGKIAGAIGLVARHGKVGYHQCFGGLDLETRQPMPEDALFRIFSMTKPITSVAAMMLFEEGKLSLDDPVSRYIPAFKKTRVIAKQTPSGFVLTDQDPEMRVWNLLTHTAGLSYGFGGMPVDDLYNEQGLLRFDEPLAEKVERIAEAPLCFQPGNRWHYSVAIDVLGRVIEIVSGQSLREFFLERIFAPLGMPDTDFYVPAEKLPRLAAVYGQEEDGGVRNLVTQPPEGSPFNAWIPMKKLFAFYSGGGGLVSSTADYARFCAMLLNQGQLDGTRLLGRKTVELMTLNHLGGSRPELPHEGFGLGFSVLLDVAPTHAPGSIGTFGWGGAASTNFWIDPVEQMYGVVMVQLMPNGPFDMAWEFRRAVYAALVD